MTDIFSFLLNERSLNSIVLYNFQKFQYMISYNPIIIFFYPHFQIAPLPFPLPTANHQVILYTCESASFLFYLLAFCIFQIPQISDIIHICFILSDISLSIIPSKSIHVVANGNSTVYICTYISLYGASQVALVVKNLLANAEDKRDSGLTPGSGISPGGEHGNPLQYSCLENPMHKGAWQTTVHRVKKSQTLLK